MKYSFIMPYYDRLEQFKNTLRSLIYHYEDRDDWEIVLVEDGKNDDGVWTALCCNYEVLIKRELMARPCSNPAPMFNAGARVARGDHLVLTNPECLHVTNVLEEFDKHPDAYRIAACLAVESCSKFTTPDALQYKVEKWYQHSFHRNRMLHFCSAIPRATWDEIGGFDEVYADGIASDDSDFRNRVAATGIEMLPVDDALVLHQKHRKLRPVGSARRLARNRKLYTERWGE